MPLYKINEAIIKDDSGKKIVVPIEQDNRFFFWAFEPALSSEQQKYELFDPRDPIVKEINDKYYYVPSETDERLEQHNTDSLLRAKMLHTQIQELPNLLNYHLAKYPDQKERLYELKSLFLSKTFFYQTPYELRQDLKERCQKWVDTLIRKKDRRPDPKKDLTLESIFIGNKSLNQVITALLEKGFVSFDPNTGRYFWEKKV